MYFFIVPTILYLSFHISYFDNDNKDFAFTVILADIFVLPLFILIALRFFDLMIKIIYSQQSKHWRLLLNPKNSTKLNNFILKHYNKLSRPKYQLIACFILYFILISLAVTATCLGSHFYIIRLISQAILWIFLCIFIITCLYKIGKFADFWFIRIELWILCAISFAVALVFIITALVEDEASQQSNDKASLLAVILISASLIIISLGLMILFPIYFNQRRDKQIQRKRVTDRNNENYESEKQQKLYILMQDKNGYEALMDHLEAEFAVENLLFLTEMIQFRDYLLDKDEEFFDDGNVKMIFENKNIILPKNTPKSPIIYPDDAGAVNIMIRTDSTAQIELRKIDAAQTPTGPVENIDERERIFMSLFRKYIDKYNARLEINISYGIHTKLKRFYDDIAEKMDEENGVGFGDDNQEVVDFVGVWNNLVSAAREITSILHNSAHRCSYK